MSEDLEWEEEKIKENLGQIKGFVEYDPKAKVVFIPSWFEHNPLASANHAKKAAAEISELPETYLYQDYYKIFYGVLEQLKGVDKGLLNDVQAAFKGRLNSEEEEEEEEENTTNKIDFDFKKKTFTGITAEDKKLWKEAYPAVDIDQEIKAAKCWLVANPNKAKKNYAKFLINWFSNSQKGGFNAKNTLASVDGGNNDRGPKKFYRKRD